MPALAAFPLGYRQLQVCFLYNSTLPWNGNSLRNGNPIPVAGGLGGLPLHGGWNLDGFQKKKGLVLFLRDGGVGTGKSHPSPDFCCTTGCPSQAGDAQKPNPINLLHRACLAPRCFPSLGIVAAGFTCQVGNPFPRGSDPGTVYREGITFSLTLGVSAVPRSTLQVIFGG